MNLQRGNRTVKHQQKVVKTTQCWHSKKLIIINTKTQMERTKIPKSNKQRNETDVAMPVSWCTDIAL